MMGKFWTNYLLRRGKMRRQRARLHFPPGCTAVRRLLEEGDYERELAGEILRCLPTGEDGNYLDVGAHIGLLSLPVLRYRQGKVYSVEASEEACRLMTQTRTDSPYAGRWTIERAVISGRAGAAIFHQHQGADAVYSGLQPTGRGESPAVMQSVTTTPLDDLWNSWNRPVLRVIKIDLEGAELSALEGAARLLEASRPTVFLEWERRNIQSHQREDADLLAWAEKHQYEVFRVPDDVPVSSAAGLRLAMERTESFRLEPARR